MLTNTIAQRRLENIIDENGNPTLRFMRFLEDLNSNSNEFIKEFSGFNEFDEVSPFLSAFMPNKDDVVVTDIDYTTITNQIIICTDALIISLNAEPKDRETAKVLITNGDVQILGNGKLVMNETDVQVITADVQGIVTLDFMYTVETDSWWIV